jgi:AP-1 complex subunit sigma 1/2
MSSFLSWGDKKVVYKRYASLFFCVVIDDDDNELITLEMIHRYVELLDKYFGSVCELDIIFNFEKAYFILDELLIGGEIQETSKKAVLKAISAMDMIQEVSLVVEFPASAALISFLTSFLTSLLTSLLTFSLASRI